MSNGYLATKFSIKQAEALESYFIYKITALGRFSIGAKNLFNRLHITVHQSNVTCQLCLRLFAKFTITS